MNFSTLDLSIFIGYIIFMMGFGIWIARGTGNETSKDYFLASGSLPWWAVGGSLIASNISTEQILGMNGSGFAIGLAISSYELLAALTLLIVAKFFLPIFIQKGIYTMPQFLQVRYDNRVRTIMAFFWVILFVFVNITSILYLGGLAIKTLLGIPLLAGIVGLVIYSATFSIFGGLKAVVWTDVIQVVVLVIGGLMASYFVVSAVGDGNYFVGLETLFEKVPEKFDMIFTKDSSYVDIETGETKSAYDLLPGISVLVGGMWIANIYYWGNNQYIIQRALASTSIKEAQRGVAFAAFLKIFMPLIVVIPGIAAYVILQDPTAYGFEGQGIAKADEAFPWVLNNYVSVGFKGLVFAALVAAIGSSISSLVNSASTIFTLDIYQNLINKNAQDSHYVTVGKIAAGASLVVGALVAPALSNLEQAFQFIQEFTGFISPGVVAVFLFGFFWGRTTANAALVAVVASIPLAFALKALYPVLPFLDRMGFSFLVLSVLIVAISLWESKKTDVPSKDFALRLGIIISLLMISVPSGLKFVLEESAVSPLFGWLILALSVGVFALLLTEKRQDNPNAVRFDTKLFSTEMLFNISALSIVVFLTVLYYFLW